MHMYICIGFLTLGTVVALMSADWRRLPCRASPAARTAPSGTVVVTAEEKVASPLCVSA